ncbi:mitogen-activated protein kinase kinase kinase 5-like isoform X1 [Primulina huaijiensis]|uniref:mitogen-activated protein kinase kinase kinase 5-like isoform X1 n=2 Tax=Primulina huaijiensis TaxID=1492673 RepID=UPI003CC74D54
MPSLWSAFSSSTSSTSSSSPANPSLKSKSKSSNDMLKNSSSTCDQNKKLNRQRKLRYLRDDEVGQGRSSSLDGSQSCPVSPASELLPRTTPHGGFSHWSNSAIPQPLPLPEVAFQSRQNDGLHGSSAARHNSHQNLGKTTDDFAMRRSCISPTYRRRRLRQHLNVDTAQNDFRIHFPARSAPSSGCSTPIHSPQRYKTVDLFHPSFNVSSALEVSTSDRISAILDHSPFQSSSDAENSRRREGILLHSHNNANVHPLPLPPAVSRPPPSTRHSMNKLDSLSGKGQWQRGRPIGRGTYGSVYVATHCETGATCAMKEVEIIPDDPICAECVRQLEQEIKFLRELKHPNIVQYYGCEIIEDRLCIYLEYVHPGSINKYVREHCGAMTESIVRNFTRHVLSGLAYLHGSKIIHRDIKGANLLVDTSGVVKLADFGLAKHLTGHHIELSLKGTPHWMAPEVLQAVMRKDANPELAYGVDIWSIGCTVIEMLTGNPPWSEHNGVQAMFNVLNKTPPIPEALSAEGKDFLQWCFQRKPEDRPSAVKLLEHPFLRSSQDQNNLGGFPQEFSGMRVPDIQSPSGWTKRNKDVVQPSSAPRIQQGKLPLNCFGDKNRHSFTESIETGVTSNLSPRSTLEVFYGISSPDLNRGSNITSPSNIQNNSLLRTGIDSLSVFPWRRNLSHLIPKMAERKK